MNELTQTIIIITIVILIAFIQAGFFGGIADNARSKLKQALFVFLAGPLYWLIVGGIMLHEFLIDWSEK